MVSNIPIYSLIFIAQNYHTLNYAMHLRAQINMVASKLCRHTQTRARALATACIIIKAPFEYADWPANLCPIAAAYTTT